MVVVNQNIGDGVRYRFLEIIHQYLAEKLLQSGEAEVIRNKHRDYYLSLAERAYLEYAWDYPSEWLNSFVVEYDNLWSALEWSVSSAADSRRIYHIVYAIEPIWEVRGTFEEGIIRLNGLLTDPGAKPGTLTRAVILAELGSLAMWQGNYRSCKAYLDESLEIISEFYAGNFYLLVDVYNTYSSAALDSGRI